MTITRFSVSKEGNNHHQSQHIKKKDDHHRGWKYINKRKCTSPPPTNRKKDMNVTMANKSEGHRPQNNPYLAMSLALYTTMLKKVTICISIKGDEHHQGHKGG
jgi:hypothetical protein